MSEDRASYRTTDARCPKCHSHMNPDGHGCQNGDCGNFSPYEAPQSWDFGNLTSSQQNRARRCVEFCAGVDDKDLEPARGLVGVVQCLTSGVDEVAAMQAEIRRLEALVYVPGVHRCPKCDLRTVSTTLHVAVGALSANNEPQLCANGCGPMWKVTERDAGNEMADRLDRVAGLNRELIDTAKLLLEQYDASGDFTMGGRLTNEPFLRFREAVAKGRAS